MRGVVAAGHPLSAEAGAEVLREGGNAVDAAVAAVLMSFVAESPLTGPGAGGFMLVHTADGEDHLLDFFVAAPGLDGPEAGSGPGLVPVGINFSDEVVQVFHVGPASCGVYGAPAGLAEASARFGTAPLATLAAPAARAARVGVALTPMQAHLHAILDPILAATPEGRAVYHPQGRALAVGERLRLPELAEMLERLGGEGPGFLYEGDVGRAVSAWLRERGGRVGERDLSTYRVIERAPARARYRGREMLTNPPPSSGGILIAYALDLLERRGRPRDVRGLVQVMDQANRARTEDFALGLHAEGFLERFMAADAVSATSPESSSSRLGSTTHLAVMDEAGACVSVTCSNGSCSGVIVPGTGLHLNNMLGEEDLSPLGFGRHEPGRRVPSMMAPTLVLGDGAVEVGLGSAGSNRIRSAILQTLLAVVDDGEAADAAVRRHRLHPEGEVIHAEPEVDPVALAALECEGWSVERWREPNLYFGGVQAVVRDPTTGALSGGGDPRRGGAAVVVE